MNFDCTCLRLMDVYDETFPSGGAEFQRRIRYCMYMYTVHLWVEEHFFVLFCWPSYWTIVVQDGRRRRSSGSLAREKIPTSFGRLRRSESLPSLFLFFLVFLLHPRRLISSFFSTTDALLYRHTHTQRRHFFSDLGGCFYLFH